MSGFEDFKQQVMEEFVGKQLDESKSDLSKLNTETLQSHHALFSNAKSGSKEFDTLKRIHAELEKRGQKMPPLKEETLDEAKRSTEIVYHPSYSAAVQHAEKMANAKGYEVDPNDWFHHVSAGPGKPSEGQTTRHVIPLQKDGKPSKKALAIQVYNRGGEGNNYELNHYIS